MQKNHSSKSKRLLTLAVAALLSVSMCAASVMSGCGSDKKDSSETSQTSAVAETTQGADEKDKTEPTEQGSTSKDEKQESSASSSKNDSSSSKNDSSSSKNDSSSKNNSSSSKIDSSSKNNSSSSKNDSNPSGKVLEVDSHKYSVGSTVTVTYKVTTPETLVNFQGYVTFDKSYLKVKSAELQKPADNSSIINAKADGKILFNGSQITKGYDYTKGGDFLVVNYEVLKEGKTNTELTWEVATNMSIDKPVAYVENDKLVKGMKCEASYS